MQTMTFALIGMWETVGILLLVLILFGAKKLPELAKGLGQGIREFRKASNEINEDLHRAFDVNDPPPPSRRPYPPQTPQTQHSAPPPHQGSDAPSLDKSKTEDSAH